MSTGPRTTAETIGMAIPAHTIDLLNWMSPAACGNPAGKCDGKGRSWSRLRGAARGEHGLPGPTALRDAPTTARAFAPREGTRGTLCRARGELGVLKRASHGVRHRHSTGVVVLRRYGSE